MTQLIQQRNYKTGLVCLMSLAALLSGLFASPVLAETPLSLEPPICKIDTSQVVLNRAESIKKPAEEAFAFAAHADEDDAVDEDLGLPYLDLEMPMADSTILYGKLYDPTQSHDENAEMPEVTKKYPLVLLLHGLNGSNDDWHGLPKHLVDNGYAVVAVDLRGHGESTSQESGRRKSWRIFKQKDWDQIPRDVDRIRRYIAKDEYEEFGHIDASKMAVIGSKLGANAALIAGDRDSDDTIQAMVLISPGLNYKGLETSFSIVHYKNPIFILTTHDDLYAVESSELLYRWALGAKAIQMYKHVGDGTDILRLEPNVNGVIVKWLARHYPGMKEK